MEEKQYQYTQMIYNKVIELFDADRDGLLSLDTLDVTAFTHAFANLAPALLYNQISQTNEDMLSFNHIANRLVFQYAQSYKTGDEVQD